MGNRTCRSWARSQYKNIPDCTYGTPYSILVSQLFKCNDQGYDRVKFFFIDPSN